MEEIVVKINIINLVYFRGNIISQNQEKCREIVLKEANTNFASIFQLLISINKLDSLRIDAL